MINPLPKKKIQQSYFVVIVSIFLYILTLSAPLPIHAAEKKAEPVLVSSYEGGKLYKVGKINLLVLNGSYSDMGKQYGKLMGHQISDMYDEIIRQYKKNGIEAKKQTIQQFSKKQFALFPQKFRLLANEMSVSSGISINKIEVINSFFDYFLLSISNEDGNHCASVTCQGPYTKNGSLITGRNFDFPFYYRNFDKYLTVVVYNPDDGSIPTAVITYPGQISSIQVFNKYGLIVENNDGSNSGDPHRLFGERIPFMIKDLMAMMDCKDLETLDIYLKTARIHYPLIYNTASPSGAYCYEMTTDEVKRRKPADGLLIGINHFVSPDWKPIDPNIPNYIDNSKTRYCNMETLVNKNKGSIDAKVMMSILDTSVSQGGPTPEDKSIYQYVAEPGSLKIYLKAREYCNWTEINLKKFFSGSKD